MALDTTYIVVPDVGMPPMFSDPCFRPWSIALAPPRLIPGPTVPAASALDYVYLNTHVALVDPQLGPNPGHPQAGAPPLGP